MFHVNEKYRIKGGLMGSDESYGNNGAFAFTKGDVLFVIIASDGEEWEHVSVHIEVNGKERTPTWDEMCFVKSVFWDEEDCVMQLHPPKSEYVNCHEYTLHLWRPINQVIPMPDTIMIGLF